MSISWRTALEAADPDRIRALVAATGFFSPDEIAIAGELADDCLAQGAASDYRFLLAEEPGRLLGYACYGPIPGTRSSWDLYWIAVMPGLQRQGLGRALLEEVEEAIRAAGGTRIYVDTSSRDQYEPTRRFYRAGGYRLAAELQDFYAPGDGKVIFVREIAGT